MSNRYNLILRNKKTGLEVSSLQLFGNNDWFPSFVPFLEQNGAKIDPEDPYIPEDEAIVITDLLAFVKAIDETVWSIIQENPMYNYKDQFGQTKTTSPVTDFTRNFFLQDNNKTTFVSNTIYMQAQLLAQTAYIFSSYNVVNWLKKYDAIIDEKVRWTKHSYTSRPDNDDLIILGELHPDFEIQLSYCQKETLMHISNLYSN